MLIALLSVNAIASTIILSSFQSLEKEKMRANIQRFHNTLDNEITQLQTTTRDWSQWDDTYQFVGGEYNEYIALNTDNETMTNLQVNVMLYMNKSGDIFFEKWFDYNEQKMMNASRLLNSYIYKNSSLVHFNTLNDSIAGIMRLPEGFMLIASLPILTSSREGPINGAMILGRYLDDSKLQLLATMTNLSVSISDYYNVNSSSDFQKASLSLTKNGMTFIEPINDHSIAGFSVETDLFGQPAFFIKITSQRDIYEYGVAAVQTFQILLIIIVLLLSIILVLFLDKTLLRRLDILSKQVHIIGEKKDFSSRLTIKGHDELNDFANLTNKTLQTIEDINRSLEQKVLDRTKKINLLLNQKNEFIHQLGHDLKTPLTPLNALVPIVKEKEQDPKLKELLHVILNNIEYMKNLVTKTLSLAQLNSPNYIFHFEEINLAQHVHQILEMEKIFFMGKNVIIHNNIPLDIVVKVDPLQMKELFDNLISNAVKYSQPENIDITLDVRNTNDAIIVSFTDTGIGLEPNQIDHVFDEFYKADPSRHDLQSTGLGLSICKRIIENHGGKIWVESQGTGKGSTFYFTIPKNKGTNQSLSIDTIHDTIDAMSVN